MEKRTITVLNGDGIGPEIVNSVLSILEAAQVPLNYERYDVGQKEFEEIGRAHV